MKFFIYKLSANRALISDGVDGCDMRQETRDLATLAADGKKLAMDLQMITPSAVDWDGDGRLDLICGDEDGRLAYVAWAVEGTAKGSIPSVLGSDYKVLDIFGNHLEHPRNGALLLTEVPVYVVCGCREGRQ